MGFSLAVIECDVFEGCWHAHIAILHLQTLNSSRAASDKLSEHIPLSICDVVRLHSSRFWPDDDTSIQDIL